MDASDIFDDDYWKGFDGGRNRESAERFGEAMNRLDELSVRLKCEAHREYVQREKERLKEREESVD